MRSASPKPSSVRSAALPPVKSGDLRFWQLLLWGEFAVNSLFFIPQCLDRWLVPRFFFLSAVLLAGIVLLWKILREKGDWRLHGFDLLLCAWYGMNLASISWAFSWSEAVFYTQKVLLLFLTYWLVRQALTRDETLVRQTLRQATTFLTFAVCGILIVQLALAISQVGLDNEKLYDYASGVFGNKSLASDFLFFLLVFNVLFFVEPPINRLAEKEKLAGKNGGTWFFWLSIGLLASLILLLQTRTVYLATGAGAVVYFVGRAILEPDFRVVFWKKIFPAGIVVLGLLAAAVALKGKGNSLAERLNPFTYLQSATANERRFVWYKTDLLNAEHFWLGVGNGSWKFWFPSKNIEGSYRLQEQNIVFTRAHNDYLEVRSEMGIVGVALFCALFGAAFLAAIWTLRRRETEAVVRHDLLVLIAGLLGYCVIQYFDFPRERIELQVVLAMLFAFIAFYSKDFWLRLPGVFIRKFSAIFLALASAGLMFNIAIGWNRIRGEIHNVRMMKALEKGDYRAVEREAKLAQNCFYEYNEVALPLAWYEGLALYQMNQPEKSVAAFERAYRLNPWSFQVVNNYASALVKNGQFREAIPLYEKVLEINPRYDDGKFNLVFTLYKAGDAPKALEWLDRVDTISSPKSDEERQKNVSLKKRQADFRKIIEGK
jgi:tetratricopeptide (TPR) repeat protein